MIAAIILLDGGHLEQARLSYRATLAIWRFLADGDPRFLRKLQEALELGQLLGFD